MAQLGDEALLQASESGDLFGVGECLDAGASASAQDGNGFTALIKAVANGHSDVVDLLLARGAPVNTPAGTHTALRAATLNGQAALVDKLLKAGADASIVSNNARTPLMGACYPRHGVPEASTKACVELLLNDANGRRTLGWQNDDGDTALHLACFGAPAAALVLAKAGAPRDVLNNRSETPDDLARRAGLRLDPGVPLPLPPAPAPAPVCGPCGNRISAFDAVDATLSPQLCLLDGVELRRRRRVEITCSTPSTRLDSPVAAHAAASGTGTRTKAQTAPTKGEAPRKGPDGRQVRQAAR